VIFQSKYVGDLMSETILRRLAWCSRHRSCSKISHMCSTSQGL